MNDKDRWRKATWTRRAKKVMKDIAFNLLPSEEVALINQQAADLRRMGEAGERLYREWESEIGEPILGDLLSTLEMLALFSQAFSRRYKGTYPYGPQIERVWHAEDAFGNLWDKGTLKKREEMAEWISRLLA